MKPRKFSPLLAVREKDLERKIHGTETGSTRKYRQQQAMYERYRRG